MTRIGSAPARIGPFVRASLWFARRKVARMAGSRTERMIEPLQALARTPPLLFGVATLELACERADSVERRLKQLAVLKAATMVDCEYCIDIGSALAHRAGYSEQQLLALSRYRESEAFSELEKLVLDYAVAMSRTPASVSDELFAHMRRHFDERQLVELTNMIALESMRARFNAALGIRAAGLSAGMVCAITVPVDA